MNLADPP